MIKTDNLNEYVLLCVLKNFCEATINDSDCSECKMNAVCDYGIITDAELDRIEEQRESILDQSQ